MIAALYVELGCVLPSLRWGPCEGAKLDAGYHSAEERAAAREAGEAKVSGRLTHYENLATPLAFRDVLISIARSARAEAA